MIPYEHEPRTTGGAAAARRGAQVAVGLGVARVALGIVRRALAAFGGEAWVALHGEGEARGVLPQLLQFRLALLVLAAHQPRHLAQVEAGGDAELQQPRRAARDTRGGGGEGVGASCCSDACWGAHQYNWKCLAH